ncbi:MAG: DUF393 domain-containing protein [Pseudomonadota bacterium]
MTRSSDAVRDMSRNAPQITVYYDGACPLCSAEIAHYARRDEAGAVHFEDISREDADPGRGLSRADALARFHARRADGTLLSGAAAFAELWRLTPGWRWLGRLARLPGLTPLMDMAYRGFLTLRPRVVRWVAPVLRARSG